MSFDPASLVDVTTSIGPLRKPLWHGPCASGDLGGITFSMLSKYLVDKERFRIQYILGLQQPERFNHRLEYGNMWHVCEEALASKKAQFVALTGKTSSVPLWQTDLLAYTQKLLKAYPFQQSDITKWYRVCKAQFPEYVKFWSTHHDVVRATPLLQEHVFDVTYQLPSGRIIHLKGKWDSADLVPPQCSCGADRTGPSAEAHSPICPANGKDEVWLMENKTKGDIDEVQMQRQLKFDLQTMLYVVSLEVGRRVGGVGSGYKKLDNKTAKIFQSAPLGGVRYNVIRRPLSGGKGTIVRHKPSKSNPMGETEDAYYSRLAQYIKDEPEHYFMRWNIRLTQDDIAKFRKECLDPILENLCDDYEWWEACMRDGFDVYDANKRNTRFCFHCPHHYLMPFGIYSSLLDGGTTDLDEYISSGSTVGLVQGKRLFPELQP